MRPSSGCRRTPPARAEACSSAAVDTANTRARGGRAASAGPQQCISPARPAPHRPHAAAPPRRRRPAGTRSGATRLLRLCVLLPRLSTAAVPGFPGAKGGRSPAPAAPPGRPAAAPPPAAPRTAAAAAFSSKASPFLRSDARAAPCEAPPPQAVPFLRAPPVVAPPPRTATPPPRPGTVTTQPVFGPARGLFRGPPLAPTTNGERYGAARRTFDGDGDDALRATVAALRVEVDALRSAQRDLRAANERLRLEVVAARRNATELAEEVAKRERLRRGAKAEVRQLRDLSTAPATPPPAVPVYPRQPPPAAYAPPAAPAYPARPPTAAPRPYQAPGFGPTPYPRQPPRTVAPENSVAGAFEARNRAAAELRRRTFAPKPRNNLQTGLRSPERRAPPTTLTPRTTTPRKLVPEYQQPPKPRNLSRRPPAESFRKRVAKGSTLYQQLQMEHARRSGAVKPLAPLPSQDTGRDGMVLPFESDVWGFTPPSDPNKHVEESSKSGRTRGSTILANMAGGSDVYRDARLAYVRSQRAPVVEDDDDDEAAAVVEL